MVSVILPTYNRAEYLSEAIHSVLNQQVEDIELLVLDDGSEDNTREVMASFEDARIRYFRLPHTGYVSRIKNFAINQSAGEYLAFIDSDDRWGAGKLQRQLKVLAEFPDVGYSITDITVFRGDQILKDYTYDLTGRGGESVKCLSVFSSMVNNGFMVYNPTIVMRRSCLQRIGVFNESMRSGDHDLNMRMAFHYKAGIIYEPLLMRRLHENNWSEELAIASYDEYLQTFEALYGAGMIDWKEWKKARANAFFKLGALYIQEGLSGEARRNFLLSLKNDPFQLGCYRALLGSWIR